MQAWLVYFAAMFDAVLQYTLTMRFLVEVNLKVGRNTLFQQSKNHEF